MEENNIDEELDFELDDFDSDGDSESTKRVLLDENGAPIDLSVFFGTENEATTNDIEQNVTNPIE